MTEQGARHAARGVRHAPLTHDGVGPEAQDDGSRHFAPYGSTNALCDETVPRSVHVDERTGEYGDDRFTVKRDRTTCPECRYRMGLGPQETRDDVREAALAAFTERKAAGFVFPSASNAFVNGYLAGAESARKHPEPEWQYGASVHLVEDGVDIEMHTLPWDDRDQAAQVVADGNADQGPEDPLVIRYVLVKRTAAVRAGEWVPAEEGEQ